MHPIVIPTLSLYNIMSLNCILYICRVHAPAVQTCVKWLHSNIMCVCTKCCKNHNIQPASPHQTMRGCFIYASATQVGGWLVRGRLYDDATIKIFTHFCIRRSAMCALYCFTYSPPAPQITKPICEWRKMHCVNTRTHTHITHIYNSTFYVYV